MGFYDIPVEAIAKVSPESIRRRPCPACGGSYHKEVCVDRNGYVLPEFSRRAKEWKEK